MLRGSLPQARELLAGVADWRALAALQDDAMSSARPPIVRSYLTAWRIAVHRLLDASEVLDDPRWETLLTDVVVDARQSPWQGGRDPVDRIGLTLLAQLRANVPGAVPLRVPAEGPPTPTIAVQTYQSRARFRWVALRMLAELDAPADLARIQSTFDASKVELAGLFGVSRQAIGQWLDAGRVPAERAEKVAAVGALAEVLARNLKTERIPGVVRRGAEAYEGMTMLDLIRADRHMELLEGTRATFDWSVTA